MSMRKAFIGGLGPATALAAAAAGFLGAHPAPAAPARGEAARRRVPTPPRPAPPKRISGKPPRSVRGAPRHEAYRAYIETCLEQARTQVRLDDGRVLRGDAAVHELFRRRSRKRQEQAAQVRAARKAERLRRAGGAAL